ncbi:hypothetical protein GCM10009422_14970 [Brevundimonas kwangchunensis]|uniref:Energy transducer TonB n=1 Tax=Brevundimonas kwangchunensis TaxID=322163 RepID=A0ABN1GV00_9CAUL
MKRMLSILAMLMMSACASTPSAPPDRGFVTLSCVVGSDRRLENCRVLRERPAGAGFAAAALQAAQSDGARAPENARPGTRITYGTEFREEPEAELP